MKFDKLGQRFLKKKYSLNTNNLFSDVNLLFFNNTIILVHILQY